MLDLGLSGTRALVVGGGAGIGLSAAHMLGEAGAAVAVADVDQSRADAAGARFAYSGDVTVRAEAERIVDRAAGDLGGLDVLINIVGMAAWASLFELDEATWELDLSRNLTQHLWVSRAAAKHMIDQGTGGRIAVVASVSGLYGAPNHGAYGAAKAGLMDLVRTMAQEWGPRGIRVNGVAPDMIATPRMLVTRTRQEMDEGARADGAPLGRYGDPEDIAGPLVFLVSDLSSFMTGQTLVVDGGQRAAFPHFKSTEFMKAN